MSVVSFARGAPAGFASIFVAVALGLGGVSPALAQGKARSTELPAIVVTATATPKPVTDLISDVQSGSIADARAAGTASTAGLLGSLPGFDLISNGGPGSTATVLLRGTSAAQSLVLLDGFRVSSVSLGQPTFEALPIMLTDRLEVLRGPASGLYGADAVGGVIQLFSPDLDRGRGPSGELAFGGLGSRRALAGYGAGQGIKGQIRLSHERSDGFDVSRPGSVQANDDRDGFERNGAMLTLGADSASGASWHAVLIQTDVDTDFDDGAFADARVLSRMQLAGVRAEQETPDGGLWQLRLGRSTDRSETVASFPGVYQSTQDQIGLANTRALGPGVELRFGVEALHQSLESTAYDAPTRRTVGYSLAISGREGPHIVQFSVRRDDSNQFDTQTHGTLAYGYVLGGGWRVGGSAATGFRAPSFNDLYYPNYGRPDIRPEHARSFELGAYLDPEGDSSRGWHAKAVLYRNQVEDLVVYAPVCPDPSPQFAFGCADNVNDALLVGAGLSLAREHGPWRWRLDADFADPQDRTLDKRLARRATRKLGASLVWAPGDWRIGTRLTLVGARYDDPANTRRLAGYGLLDFSVARRFGGHWEAFMSVTNAADRDYTTASGYAQQGRLLMAGVRYPAR
ncbi:MAG: TonB-dependent receptor [Burkholderiaceae bacterium]